MSELYRISELANQILYDKLIADLIVEVSTVKLNNYRNVRYSYDQDEITHCTDRMMYKWNGYSWDISQDPLVETSMTLNLIKTDVESFDSTISDDKWTSLSRGLFTNRSQDRYVLHISKNMSVLITSKLILVTDGIGNVL